MLLSAKPIKKKTKELHMGSFLGIWIKVISCLLLTMLLVVSYIIYQKPFKWKSAEFVVILVLGVGILTYGIVNVSYIINPKIETVKAAYVCQYYKGTVLGNAYIFEDEKGNIIDLDVDPITRNKCLHKKQFDDDKVYSLTFETQSNTITSVKELNDN